MIDAVATGKDLVQDPHGAPKTCSHVAILVSNLRLLGSHRRLLFLRSSLESASVGGGQAVAARHFSTIVSAMDDIPPAGAGDFFASSGGSGATGSNRFSRVRASDAKTAASPPRRAKQASSK